MNGNSGIINLYFYAGNPTNVSASEFSAPAGAIVLDTSTPALYVKTSALGDNSAFNAVADASTITAIVTAAPTGLAAAIATLITGSDLTVSGTLTTLATNVTAHATQGLALGLALKAETEIVTAISPVTTNSQNFNTSKQDETVFATPAGTIAAFTIVFPSDANSRIGQQLRLVSTQIVSTLTVTSSALTLLGTAVTALAVNADVVYKKVAASTWLRIK